MPSKRDDGHLHRRSGDGDAIRRNGAGSTARVTWESWFKVGIKHPNKDSHTFDACGRACRAPHREAPFHRRQQ
jgi:hypothetical protein